ncbi:unnamed protein product [Merluccius merluccius]
MATAQATASQVSRQPDAKTIHQNTFAASAQALESQESKEEAFQLDHAALLSILRDEGVGAMRVGSATPESTKPYNYLPQRVTVMKSHQKAGPITGPMRVSQFFLDPAAMRSTLHGEGVKANGPLDKTPSNTGRGTSIYTGGIGRVHGAEVEQDEKSGGGQPFLQQPHRESVIFFSTGKKLFRAPRVEKPEGLIQSEQHGDALVAQRATEPGLDGKRPEFDPAGLRKHFAPSLQRDFLVHKSSAAASPAMALLLKRRLLLDELRLDEEVATYTCCSVPEAQPFQPPRPRCGNPLASFLHFQDSTMFVPVGYDGSPGSASPLRD